MSLTLLHPSRVVPTLSRRRMGFGTGPSGGGSAPGQPEVTEVSTTADVNWSLHNKYLTLYDAAGSVGVRLNGGALREKSQVDFTGLSGADFVTGGDGKYFLAPRSVIQDTVWFNTGGEVQPSGAIGNIIEVVIAPGDSASQIAATALATLEDTTNFQDAGTSGAVLVFENVATGPQVNANAGDSGTTVSTLVEGRAAAGAVGGATRSVIVPFAQNASAAAIATAIETAFSGDTGLSAVAASDQITFTDLANGPRTDAADGDTGFTISTSQQGA